MPLSPLLLTLLIVPPPDAAAARGSELRAIGRLIFALVTDDESTFCAAVEDFTDSARHNPSAAAPQAGLALSYERLGRPTDALAAARRWAALAPGDVNAWLAAARLAEATGRAADARAAIERACKLPAAPADAFRALGRARSAAGDRAGAVSAFDEAFRRFGAAADALDSARAADTAEAYRRAAAAFRKVHDRAAAADADLEAARCLAATGRPGDAADLIIAVIDAGPRPATAYPRLAAALRDAGRKPEFIPTLQRWAERFPNDPAPKRELAAELAGSDPAAAEDLYRSIIASHADSAAYRGLFQLLAGHGRRLAEATTMYKARFRAASVAKDEQDHVAAATESAHARAITAAARDPQLVRELLRLTPPLLVRPRGDKHEPDLAAWLVGLADAAGQADDAAAVLRAVLANRNLALEHEIYNGLIMALQAAGRHDEVIGVCERGLQSRNTSAVLFHYRLSQAYARLGRDADALSHADEAVAKSSDQGRLGTRLLRATTFASCGRVAEAEAECRTLLEEAVTPAEEVKVRHGLSNVYSIARRTDDAAKQLVRVLELDPNDAQAHNDLGYFWAERGYRLADAERLIRRALELDRSQRRTEADDDDDNAAYLDSLGWVLFRRGNVAESREWLLKAAALPRGRRDATVWDHLGDVCWRLGDAAAAKRHWARAAELLETEKRRHDDPRGADVRRKLGMVR